MYKNFEISDCLHFPSHTCYDRCRVGTWDSFIIYEHTFKTSETILKMITYITFNRYFIILQQLHFNRYCSNIIEKRIRVGITVTWCFHWVGITETSTFCVGICQTSAIGITETQSVGIIQSPLWNYTIDICRLVAVVIGIYESMQRTSFHLLTLFFLQ